MNGDRRKVWSGVIVFPNRRKISFFDSNHCLCGPPHSPQNDGRRSFLSGYTSGNLTKRSEAVSFRLLQFLSAVAGPRLSDPIFSSAHRRRYAQAQKPLTEICLWDQQSMVGMDGDWCCGLPIEGALRSGVAMAGRILADFP